MKTLLAVLSICVVCSGCCVSKGKVTRPDGLIAEFANTRFIWSTEQYDFAYTTNGVSLKATKSNPDAQTVAAIADLVKTASTAAAAKLIAP
jgi:hypothetical protein